MAADKRLKQFGARVKALRKERGMSLTDMAAAIDSDRSAVAKIERGERNVTFNTIAKIADALGVEIHELFQG